MDTPDSFPFHIGSGFPSRIRQKIGYLFSRKDKELGDTKPGEGRGSCWKQRAKQQSLFESSLPPCLTSGAASQYTLEEGSWKILLQSICPAQGQKSKDTAIKWFPHESAHETIRGEALLTRPPLSLLEHRQPGTTRRWRDAWNWGQ